MRLKAKLAAFKARIKRLLVAAKVSITSIRTPQWLINLRDDIWYFFSGKYIPAHHAARLAFEHTENAAIGRFVYEFAKGDPQKVLNYYVYWMVERGALYGRLAPSKVWGQLMRPNGTITAKNTFAENYTPQRVYTNVRISRRDFAAFITTLTDMGRICV